MFIEFFNMLELSFGVTGPIFITVLLGIWLKYVSMIDDDFMDKASKLVFVVALPVLLFTNVVKTDLSAVLNPTLLIVSAAATCIVFVMLSVISPWVVNQPRDKGVFVQGAFRGNVAIMGLALCTNAYGNDGLAAASILMSVFTLLYNVLSVLTLNSSLNSHSQKLSHVFVNILKNPLVVAIMLGLVVNALSIPMPSAAMKAGSYVSQMTLPLALLCIGGSLSLNEMRTSSSVAFWAVFAKLVVTPAIILWIVYLFGFRGMDLGIVFLMVSTPTAAASYIMVQAMNGNAKLAANIVVVGTLLSVFTISIGLALLKAWQFI